MNRGQIRNPTPLTPTPQLKTPLQINEDSTSISSSGKFNNEIKNNFIFLIKIKVVFCRKK